MDYVGDLLESEAAPGALTLSLNPNITNTPLADRRGHDRVEELSVDYFRLIAGGLLSVVASDDWNHWQL